MYRRRCRFVGDRLCHPSSPDATTAYIYAVMARDRGDCRLAVSYYDKALALTWSDSVAAERDEAANCARQ